MPNYKGHICGAVFFYIIILLLLIFFFTLRYILKLEALIWLFAILAGSLFPDIDTKSKGQKYFFRVICIVFIGAIFAKSYYLSAGISSFCFLPLLVNHRSIFHNWFFLLILTIILSSLLSFYCPEYKKIITISSIFFYLGALSHLWLDLGFKKMLKLK